MHHPKFTRKAISLAVAGACLSAATAFAQEAGNTSTADTSVPTGAAQATNTQAGATQTVVVTGLRASLATSLNLKRQSDGIVDGIVAEDIGKFPDTNLAESLQRISGVSISRNNGEGSQVTVRGIDPGLNMVLLNGRQIPNAGGTSRAFDFGNLASEAISQLQVYKTSRAETPTGGIGATINVMTARPLDRKGFYGSVGVKGVYDKSNNNLPEDDRTGKAFTPEFSALVSSTSADGRWGFGASASYQKRNSGRAVAAVSSEWQGPWVAGASGSPRAADAPQSGSYIIPQNMNYSFTGTSRERTNGQLVLQFAPTKDVTTTLDYTYAKNEVHTLSNDVSAWFNRGPGTSQWTDYKNGMNSPLVYSEDVTNADFAMGATDNSSAANLNSLGFNAVWKVNNDFRLEFDVHHSVAENKTTDFDGGLVATASFSRGKTTVDFRNEFPVLNVQGVDFARAPQETQGTILSPFYSRNSIDQATVKGRLRVFEDSQLLFGLSAIKQKNRSATALAQADAWGAGAGGIPAAQYPTSLWHDATVGKYFSELGGSSDPALIQSFHTFKQKELLAYMRANAPESQKSRYQAPKDWNQSDRRTEEKSQSLYAQLNTDWDTAMPMHTAIGVRYEKTDVTSAAQVASASALVWGSENEIVPTFGPKVFTTLTGKYKYVLPSIDWDMDVTPDVKIRASYGETIGRPAYNLIQGGQTIDSIYRADFGGGEQGNPALKPVKSKNIDLSAEWYYAKQSFIAVNAFWKRLNDFPTSSTILASPFGLRTPIGGALYNEALATGNCATASNERQCVRAYIFANHPTAPGVDVANGKIVGQANDPLAIAKIRTYANAGNNSLRGLEFNVQHMFGNSGFGVTANYTYVHSGLRYDNTSTGAQTPLVGLSNSANVVGIFENEQLSTRLAYNWRGEFLSGFGSQGPAYVEPFGQLDWSIGYNVAKNLTVSFEAFNLTNQTTRVHNRTKEALRSVEQNGTRYAIGARYKF